MPDRTSKVSAVAEFEQEGYLVLRGIVSQEICAFGVQYFKLLRDAGMLHRGDDLVTTCWSGYGLPFTETMLSFLVSKVSETIDEELLPTYSFSRVYLPGAEMKAHTDRPSCEVSGTLTLGHSTPEPWSIFMKNKDQESMDIKLNTGDMLLYKGEERPHWREKWNVDKGNWQIQVFFHFVRADGEHKDLIYDGRPCLAAQSTTPDEHS